MEQQSSIGHPSLQHQQHQQQQQQQQQQTHLAYLSNQSQLLPQQPTVPLEPRSSPQSRHRQHVQQQQQHQALDTKKRAPPCRWLPADDAVMTRVLLQEKRAGNETEHGFLPSSWNKVVEALQSITSQGQPKTVGPCKDRYKLMIRTIYLPFKELRSNEEFEWNEDEQRFTAPDTATWDRYIETHPHAVKFKTTGFPLFAEFEELVGHKRPIAGLTGVQSPHLASSHTRQSQSQPQTLAGEQGQSDMDITYDLMEDPATYLYSHSTALNPTTTINNLKRPSSSDLASSDKRPRLLTPVSVKDEPTIRQLVGLIHRLSESVDTLSRRLSSQQHHQQQQRQSTNNSTPIEESSSFNSTPPPVPIPTDGPTMTKMRATNIIDKASILPPDIKLRVLLRLVWDESLAQVVCGLSENGGLRDEFLREIGEEERAVGEPGDVRGVDVDVLTEGPSRVAVEEGEEEEVEVERDSVQNI
ncbi:Myb/SANT-like domain [Phaffia rhodozyma]|uniref:Myb/SANT-like domain n=1 Tax=Phaffia rhodozyma TaxID=264483 RepID=A0A0F7SX56_PHARH|nr:Myb/SANT-like domain [Phaffia rhodozyma]